MRRETTFKIEDRMFQCDDSAEHTGTFEVQSSPRPYRVTWDDNANPIERINTICHENKGNALLIDEKIYALYRDALTVPSEQILAIPATENFKTLEGVHHVFDFLYQRGFTKGECLVVVGGGIVQDIGAFASASYKRGIKWIYCPTTLLSMCDSCIGAKSGVNFKDAKNQIGLFSAPSQVIINPNFLKTLSDIELRSGLGEILKLCITGGDELVKLYQQHVVNGSVRDAASYKTLILTALSVKRAIIEVDEFDISYRKSLNYGHTLGHAIEVLTDYAIPHGVAVTVGMMLSNEISQQRDFLTVEKKISLNKLCRELLDDKVLSIMADVKIDALLGLLKNDKKAEGNFISYVVVSEPGHARLTKLKLDADLQTYIGQIMQQTFTA